MGRDFAIGEGAPAPKAPFALNESYRIASRREGLGDVFVAAFTTVLDWRGKTPITPCATLQKKAANPKQNAAHSPMIKF
jgi:hypothetical protein